MKSKQKQFSLIIQIIQSSSWCKSVELNNYCFSDLMEEYIDFLNGMCFVFQKLYKLNIYIYLNM